MLAVAGLSALVFTAETRGVVTLVALFIPLYAAGRTANRLGVALPLLAGVVISAMNPLSVWSDLLFPPLYLVLAWLFGRMMYNRDQLAEVLAEEAAHVEATRDALAAAAVVDERLRIARDLHDVGAHSLSMIVLQAEAGKRNAAGADRAAEAIIEAASSAVVEVEGLVRGAEPAARLAALDELCSDARARGLSVSVHVADGVAAVPPEVDAVAYRVVQEALTNVVKHAGATSVSVTIAADDDELHVDVIDAGGDGSRPTSLHGGGHGLAGMRERVEGVGGSLDAGPVPDGAGFAVSAVLPLERAAAPA
jgi:signal transduction histidine kinase